MPLFVVFVQPFQAFLFAQGSCDPDKKNVWSIEVNKKKNIDFYIHGDLSNSPTKLAGLYCLISDYYRDLFLCVAAIIKVRNISPTIVIVEFLLEGTAVTRNTWGTALSNDDDQEVEVWESENPILQCHSRKLFKVTAFNYKRVRVNQLRYPGIRYSSPFS